MIKEAKHILKKIKEYDTIAIFRHSNSDMDALGAQFGLKSWIEDNFRNKKVYCLGENHQKYTKNFIPKSDIFDGDGKFLAICLDVNTIARTDAGDIFSKGDYKICIDHHYYDEHGEYDYKYVDNTGISCCEIVAEILLSLKKKMTTLTCKYLYAGIYSDSGGFFYPDTSSKTLSTASKLLEIGNFNPYLDIHMIIGMKSIKDLEINNFLFSKMVLSESGFAYYENSIKDLESMQITAAEANEKISNFNRVEEIKIFLAASEQEDHTYRCSIRSKTINIRDVAFKYGGGGHLAAAGVKNIDKETLEKMKQELLELTK